MSLAELRRSTSNPKPVRPKTSGNQFKSIENKLNKLVENLEKFENETSGITQQKFSTVQRTNNQLIKEIEDELSREMIQANEEGRMTILRFQKALAGYRKKLNQLLQAKKAFIEEESTKLDESQVEEEDEADHLLNGVKIETYEEYVQERDRKIKNIHKDMGVIHQIIQGIGQMAQKQSEDIEVIVDDFVETEIQTGKANKDLVSAAKNKSTKPKKYYKLIISLVLIILLSVYLIKRKYKMIFIE